MAAALYSTAISHAIVVLLLMVKLCSVVGLLPQLHPCESRKTPCFRCLEAALTVKGTLGRVPTLTYAKLLFRVDGKAFCISPAVISSLLGMISSAPTSSLSENTSSQEMRTCQSLQTILHTSQSTEDITSEVFLVVGMSDKSTSPQHLRRFTIEKSRHSGNKHMGTAIGMRTFGLL